MGQQASSHFEQSTKAGLISSADAGDMQLWRSSVEPQAYYLQKDVTEWRRRLTASEIFLIIQREAQLPRSVIPIWRIDGSRNDLADCSQVITELSADSLQREVDRLNEEGCTMHEDDVTALLGVLLFTAMAMENNLEFHRSICMKNIFLVGKSVFLLNPYIKDSHISKVLETVVRPIEKMGDKWRLEYWTNLQLRRTAANHSDEIQFIIQKHSQILGEMVLSIGIVILSVCTGMSDENFFSPDGTLNHQRVSEGLSVLNYLI